MLRSDCPRGRGSSGGISSAQSNRRVLHPDGGKRKREISKMGQGGKGNE